MCKSAIDILRYSKVRYDIYLMTFNQRETLNNNS